ncbi:MAG: hypothetical protein ACKOJF_03480, partial [Planctomycetaceae bacterium]
MPPRGPQSWPNMLRWLACACLLTTIALGRETRGADPVPLRVEVVDAETGRPLACRVYLNDAQGEPYFARPLTPAGKTLEYNVRRSPTSHEQHSTVSADPFGFQVSAQSRLRLICERGKEYLP